MAITQREFCTVEKDGHLTIVTINRPDVILPGACAWLWSAVAP